MVLRIYIEWALSLAKDCYSMKLDLATNATVVDDAIRFVSQKSKDKEKESSSSNNNEDNKDIAIVFYTIRLWLAFIYLITIVC